MSVGLAGSNGERASAISVAGARPVARRRPGAGRRAVAAAVASVGILAACGPDVMYSPATSHRLADPTLTPTPVASAGATGGLELLALIGTPGDMRLVMFDGDLETEVPLPDRDARWVSGSASGGLVVTAGPLGRILDTGPLRIGDRPAWRELSLEAEARRWLGRPLAVAVADPAGGAVAAVAADPGSGTADARLVILDRTGGPSRVVLLPGRWDGRAPAWLGSGRIAVPTRGADDAPGLAILDRATGRSLHWGDAVGAFAASGDGRTVAYQDSDDRRILVGPVDVALAGESLDPLPTEQPAQLAAQVLLDAAGRRLAIAWLDDAGDTTSYSIYARAAEGWRLDRVGPLPRGTSRAVLVSLGP